MPPAFRIRGQLFGRNSGHFIRRPGPISAIFLYLILTVATGCPGLQRVVGEAILPPEDEIALGEQLAREVEAHYDIHHDQVIQSYISDLGAILVDASGEPRPEITWTFQVIDEPESVNAMALPGGWIYIYSGLLLSIENEAELVAVLGHEIAHINERHVAERLATIYGVEVLAAVALGRDPGTLERIVATILAQGYLLRYSRGQEREADSLAIEYSIEAGWDPRGLAWFFQRLEDAPRPPEWLSTHPSPAARVEFVEERIGGREIPTRTAEERFQRAQQRLRADEPEPVGDIGDGAERRRPAAGADEASKEPKAESDRSFPARESKTTEDRGDSKQHEPSFPRDEPREPEPAGDAGDAPLDSERVSHANSASKERVGAPAGEGYAGPAFGSSREATTPGWRGVAGGFAR